MISKNKVNHSGDLNSKIFILGEAPSSDDDYQGEPFVGESGNFLNHCLTLAGIDRSDCRIGNVSNYRPDRNEFKLLHGTRQLDESQKELSSYLSERKPKIIIALGNESLRYLKDHPGISDWRGSVLPYQNNSFIIPTYHPAAALKEGTFAPQIIFDLTKAKRILDYGFTPPTHDFIIDPDPVLFSQILEEVKEAKFIAADIETGRETQHIKCFGFAVSATRAICLRNHYADGIEQEFSRRISEVINAAKSITYHNGSYDTAQLWNNQTTYSQRLDYDTMLAQRVLEPELPIGLAFCASIYTDEIYYKGDGKETGQRVTFEKLAVYNCKDCIVTWQTRESQEQIFQGDRILDKDKVFIFARIPLMQEFQRNGMLVDEVRRNQLKSATEKRLSLAESIIAICCKMSFDLDPKYSLNFRSPKQIADLLYTKLKLPHRTNYDGGLTTDENAIVSLLQFVQEKINSSKKEETKDKYRNQLYILKALLDIRGYEKQISSYYNAKTSTDGRIRSSYYPAGTDTGRWSCGLYVDGTGLNAQTLPRESIEVTI